MLLKLPIMLLNTAPKSSLLCSKLSTVWLATEIMLSGNVISNSCEIKSIYGKCNDKSDESNIIEVIICVDVSLVLSHLSIIACICSVALELYSSYSIALR